MTTVTIDYPALFRSRRLLCQTLLDFSHRQSDLIQQQQYDELFDVLTRKQRVLERLGSLGNGELWKNWRQHRDTLTKAEQDDCDALLAETESILKDLMSHEQASTDQLVLQRDSAQAQLAELSSGVKVHQEYQTDDHQPRQLDLDR